MNRRHFITAAGAATLLTVLAGCKKEPDGEKFLGYWKSDSKYDPDAIHITRNGDSFLFTVVTKDPFGGGYQTHKLPAKLENSDNILTVGDKHIAYDENADHIVSGRMKAHRATEVEYLAIAQQASATP
ncbi:MAG: twin-arginine translocation signal domain-containing protein [Alcaligenes aquatilis]